MEFENTEKYSKILKAAIRFIQYRPRSIHETRNKLIGKGFENNLIEDVIRYLIETHWLNDENFCNLWVESRLHSQYLGPYRIQRELKEKGIDEDMIANEIEKAYSEKPMSEWAVNCLNRKYHTNIDKENIKKALDYLIRRGYAYTTAKEAVKIFNEILEDKKE